MNLNKLGRRETAAARDSGLRGKESMTRQLRIAFFGSSLVSAYWNGAATYYGGMIEALHALGHRITFYEPDAQPARPSSLSGGQGCVAQPHGGRVIRLSDQGLSGEGMSLWLIPRN